MAELIKADTANILWDNALNLVKSEKGVKFKSDRGLTREVLHVFIELDNPREKWMYDRFPPMNIGFALAELLWIMGGRDDVKLLDFWCKDYKNYTADVGSPKYHGAYGYRLRHNFGFDQLERAYNALKNAPENRQTVLIIWDASSDMPQKDGMPQSKDIPCNICSLLKIRDNKLEWSQIMRSNDLYLGLPYNLIQFTSLQEILAGWIGVEVGTYNHYSDSLHLYDNNGKINIDNIKSANLKSIKNTDSLSIPKEAFDLILKDILSRMDILSEAKPTEAELFELCQLNSEYNSYNNIIYIVGAYAAKQYNYMNESTKLIKMCDNTLYKTMWQNWLVYNMAKSKNTSPSHTSK